MNPTYKIIIFLNKLYFKLQIRLFCLFTTYIGFLEKKMYELVFPVRDSIELYFKEFQRIFPSDHRFAHKNREKTLFWPEAIGIY